MGFRLFLGAFCCICLSAKAQNTPPSAAVTPQLIQPSKDSATNNRLLTIGNIVLKGNKKTKNYILLRELLFKTGDVLTEKELAIKLQQSKEFIFNTALFLEVTATIANIQNNVADIEIAVKERWYFFPLPYFRLVSRNFNQWWVNENRSLDRVNYGIKFMQANTTGQNDNLNIWLINGYNKQITARYGLPFVDKSLRHGFNVGFLYATQREINYTTQYNKQVFFKYKDVVRSISRFDATYSYRPDQRWRHYVRMSYTAEKVADTVLQLNPQFNPKGLTSMRYPDISYTAQYYNLDYIVYPKKGYALNAGIYKRGLNSATNLWQIGAQATWALPITSSSFLRFEAAGAYRFPNQAAYTTSRLFGFGDFQMRGLEYYVVDGTAGALARATLHKQLFKYIFKNPIKSKTHDKIPFTFYFKLFGDLGYSHNKFAGNSMLNNQLLRTCGLGIDIVSIYDFVFKIDFSFNQLGNQGLYLQSRNDF